MFGLLGIAPGPHIGLPAAASIAGLPIAQTRALLRGLEQMSLLDQDSDGRYQMHDLIRQYAAQHAPSQDREAALRRVVDFYLHTVRAAHDRLDPNWGGVPQIDPDLPVPGCDPQSVPDMATALEWFEVEYPCLLAVINSAVIIQEWPRVVWQMVATLETFQTRRGLSQDRLAAADAGVVAADRLADPAVRSSAERIIGGALAGVGRYRESMQHYQRGLEIAAHAHDREQQTQGHRVLAFAWKRLDNPKEAIKHATRGLRLCQELNNPLGTAIMLITLGWCTARLGDVDQGREQLQEALILHRRFKNPDGEAEALEALATIDHYAGHHAEAVVHYRRALTLFRVLGDSYAEAGTLTAIGDPYVALGQYDDARAAWREAIQQYRELGRDDDATRIQRQLDDLDQPGVGIVLTNDQL